jgi:hypothetical protein
MTVSWVFAGILGVVLLVLLLSLISAHASIDAFRAELVTLRRMIRESGEELQSLGQAYHRLNRRLTAHIRARPRKPKTKAAPEEPKPTTRYDLIAADDEDDDAD